MKTTIQIAGIFTALLLLAACSSKTKYVEQSVPFSIKFGNENLELNTLYTTSASDSVRVADFKIYLSEIQLLKSDGSAQSVGNIFYFALPNSLTSPSFNIPEGTYKGIRFNFGLTDSQNSRDSMLVPCPSPLCADKGMWWSDSLKYTWIAINGGVKVNGGNEFNSMVYHIGTSPYRRTITLNQDINVSGSKPNFGTITLDMKKIIDGENPFNMNTENICETTDFPHTAVKFADNITNAFSISQQ